MLSTSRSPLHAQFRGLYWLILNVELALCELGTQAAAAQLTTWADLRTTVHTYHDQFIAVTWWAQQWATLGVRALAGDPQPGLYPSASPPYTAMTDAQRDALIAAMAAAILACPVATDAFSDAGTHITDFATRYQDNAAWGLDWQAEIEAHT